MFKKITNVPSTAKYQVMVVSNMPHCAFVDPPFGSCNSAFVAIASILLGCLYTLEF